MAWEISTQHTLLFRFSWYSILIMLKVLSWHIEYLSIQMLCNASMHKELYLANQDSALCFVKNQVLNNLNNSLRHRFLLPNLFKYALAWIGASWSSTCYIWIIVSISIKRVKYFYVNHNASCCDCANLSLLKIINNYFLQSRTYKVSSSGSVKQHWQIAELQGVCRCSWWVVPSKFSNILLSQRFKSFGMRYTNFLHNFQSILIRWDSFRLFFKKSSQQIKCECVVNSLA